LKLLDTRTFAELIESSAALLALVQTRPPPAVFVTRRILKKLISKLNDDERFTAGDRLMTRMQVSSLCEATPKAETAPLKEIFQRVLEINRLSEDVRAGLVRLAEEITASEDDDATVYPCASASVVPLLTFIERARRLTDLEPWEARLVEVLDARVHGLDRARRLSLDVPVVTRSLTLRDIDPARIRMGTVRDIDRHFIETFHYPRLASVVIASVLTDSRHAAQSTVSATPTLEAVFARLKIAPVKLSADEERRALALLAQLTLSERDPALLALVSVLESSRLTDLFAEFGLQPPDASVVLTPEQRVQFNTLADALKTFKPSPALEVFGSLVA